MVRQPAISAPFCLALRVFALLILDQHRPVSQDMLNWPSNIELLRYQACRNRHKSRRIHRYFFQRRATTQASAKSRQNASVSLFLAPFFPAI